MKGLKLANYHEFKPVIFKQRQKCINVAMYFTGEVVLCSLSKMVDA